MEQGEYKVGLDTLLRILQTFDLSIGDFFDESGPAESIAERVRRLSPSAQREVEDFIEFKRRQEHGELREDEREGGSEDA